MEVAGVSYRYGRITGDARGSLAPDEDEQTVGAIRLNVENRRHRSAERYDLTSFVEPFLIEN